jgi:8-oxo-dGTP diphosphatase
VEAKVARSEVLTTLCYLERDGRYLMMHRISKKNDINKDKWIGVGGHFEDNESPEECIKREILEETGYDLPLSDLRYRAVITFISDKGDYELMSLFTADAPNTEPIPCSEGVFEWVRKEDVYDLNLWEGDRIFFRLLEESRDFFSLKLWYDKEDRLTQVILNGKEMTIN